MQPNQGVAGAPGVQNANNPTGTASPLATNRPAEPSTTPSATPSTNNLPKIDTTPEPPKENLMASGASEQKGGKGMLIGLILCLILAIGGIGFGVWAMMDGNSQIEALNAQITSLKSQNSDLRDQITELQDTITTLKNTTDETIDIDVTEPESDTTDTETTPDDTTSTETELEEVVVEEEE